MGKWGIGRIHFLIIVISVAATLFIFANPSLTYGQSVEILGTAGDPTWKNFPDMPLELIDLYSKEKFGDKASGCETTTKFYTTFKKDYYMSLGVMNIRIPIVYQATIPANFVDKSTCLSESETQIAVYDGRVKTGPTTEISCGSEQSDLRSTSKIISKTAYKSTTTTDDFSWTAGITLGQEAEVEPFTVTAEETYSQTTTTSLSETTGEEITAENKERNQIGLTASAGENKIIKISEQQRVIHVKQSVWKATSFNPGENWKPSSDELDTSIVSYADLYTYGASICKNSDWGRYPDMPSCVPAPLNFQFVDKFKMHDPGDDSIFEERKKEYLKVHQEAYSDIRDFTLEQHFSDKIHPALVSKVKMPGSEDPEEFKYSLAYKSIENPSTLFGFTSVIQEIPTIDAYRPVIRRDYNCEDPREGIINIPPKPAKQKLQIWGVPSLGHTQVIVTNHRDFVVEDAEVIVGTYSFPLVEGEKTCFSAESRLKTDNYGAAYFVLGQPIERTCNQSGSNLIPMLGDLMITATHPDHLPATVKLVWENSLWDIVEVPDEEPPKDDPPKDDPPGNGVEIPEWIKEIAGLWCADEIGSSDFVQVIQWMISEGLIILPQDPFLPQSSTSSVVPSWVQFNACVWYDGTYSDKEFSATLQWLIENGIIKI